MFSIIFKVGLAAVIVLFFIMVPTGVEGQQGQYSNDQL